MSFIGAKPTAVPLTASDITDGIITSAKITDGTVAQADITDQAINEAKMQISNAPTNDYVLTAQSGNTGGMTWAEAGGGGWIKISTVTASSSATVDFDNIASTYQMYAIIGSQIKPATDNILFQTNFGTDGSTYASTKTSLYATQYNNEGDSDGALEKVQGYSLGNSTANQTLGAGLSNGANTGKAGTMVAFFGGVGQNSAYASYNIEFNYFGANNYIQQNKIAGQIQGNADCIRFLMSAGTISTGKFTLFGIDQ